MRRPRPTKNFPALTQAVDELSQGSDQVRQLLAQATGCSTVLFGVPLLGILVANLSGNWMTGLITAAASLPFLMFGSLQFMKWAVKPRTEQETFRRDVRTASKEFTALAKKRSLHKNVDPAALHILEAGAHHWLRAKASLDSSFWEDENLPGHWLALKEQIGQASDRAMGELVLLAVKCIGEPNNDRKQDIEGMVSDFVELDWIEALDSLKRLTSTDWTAYAHRSPYASGIYEPGRQIATRLKDLADEVEEMRDQTIQEQVEVTVASAESIDVLLSELRAVKEAETELEQEH